MSDSAHIVTMPSPRTGFPEGRPGLITRPAILCIVFFILCLTLTGCATHHPAHPSFPMTESLSDAPLPPIHKEDSVFRAYSEFGRFAILGARGDYETALVYLQKAVKHDPESVFLNHRMALVLKQLKDYDEALTYAKRCIELDPAGIDYHLLAAEIAGLMGNEEDAAGFYMSALELAPDHIRARLVLSTFLIKLRRYEDALAQLELIIEQDPNLVIAHYYRGRVYLEKGDMVRSEENYLEALRLNERMEPALFDLGSLYQMRGLHEKAVTIYERFINYYPANTVVRERLIDLYYTLEMEYEAEKQIAAILGRSKPGERARQSVGLIYLRYGKLDESIFELSKIVQSWPEDDKSRYYLAAAYEERGDKELALGHFRHLERESEYYTNAQMHIAYILDSEDKSDEAVGVLREALSEGEDRGRLTLMLSSILEGQKKYDEAEAVVREALDESPASIDLIYRLGVILDKKGDKEGCLDQMRRILEIDPDHADAMNYIGYTWAEQGINLDEALVLIKRAVEIKPDSGYIIDSLGWVYYQKGEYVKALEYLEKAIDLQPGDPTITEHLGDAYLKNDLYEKALEAYRKALTLEHTEEPEVLLKKIDEVELLLKKDKEMD